MIDVTGRDGRIHSFADGTTQAQIDAALEAIYGTSHNMSSHREAEAPPKFRGSFSTVQVLGFALVVAVIALLAMAAMMMSRDKPAATTAQTPNAGSASVLPTDQLPVATPTPGGPAVTPEVFAGFVATPLGGNVTIRATPELIGAQVTKLAHGAPISVTGYIVMPDGLWRQVSVGGATGFVKGEYISQTQPAAIAKAPASEAKMIPREFWGFATTKSSKSVNVRASPTTSAQVNASLPAGEYVYVVAEQGAWYLIEWKGKRGWINSSYISREEPD